MSATSSTVESHPPDVELLQERGQGLAQTLHSELASAVHAVERHSHEAAHAAHVDDVTFLLRLHFRQHGFGDTDNAEEVRVETFLNRVHRLRLQRTAQADTCVIDFSVTDMQRKDGARRRTEYSYWRIQHDEMVLD